MFLQLKKKSFLSEKHRVTSYRLFWQWNKGKFGVFSQLITIFPILCHPNADLPRRNMFGHSSYKDIELTSRDAMCKKVCACL